MNSYYKMEEMWKWRRPDLKKYVNVTDDQWMNEYENNLWILCKLSENSDKLTHDDVFISKKTQIQMKKLISVSKGCRLIFCPQIDFLEIIGSQDNNQQMESLL